MEGASLTPDDVASRDPGVGLAAAAALRRLADRLEELQVANARELGWSWQQIATALGVTRQAAHKKHAVRVGDVPPTVMEKLRVALEEMRRAGKDPGHRAAELEGLIARLKREE